MNTTIVMPVLNQIKCTLATVDSLFKYTHTPFTLHIVDNGSKKKVAKKLTTIEPQGECRKVTVHSPGENLGYGGALNLVFKQVRSKYVVSLNSDLWLTDYWLSNMISILDQDEEIGSAGPATNYAAGIQMIEGAPAYVDSHKKYLKVYEWVHDFTNGNVNSFVVDFLVGFCQIFRRSAIAEVDYFDEQFHPGNYEDNDIAQRLIIAGYKLLFTPSSFVFHIGHATFEGEGIDLQKSLAASKVLFDKKWSG